jgi:predicted thioesterase
VKSSLRPGISKITRVVIDAGRTIGFMGDAGRVYGTPHLVSDIEHTCRDLLLEHGDTGEDSVGAEVSIRHLAPTLLGMAVEVSAVVSAVDGRKVTFEVSAKDDLEQICLGTHTRFVVDVAKTIERLKTKSSKHTSSRSG